MKTHCKRGHPFTEKNTQPKKLQNGYIVRQCRCCRSILDNLRYQNDPKRQAAIRARALVARALQRSTDGFSKAAAIARADVQSE